MSQSNIEKKISHLQQEIKSLKSSQILGGDNTRVYHKYVEGESAWVRWNSDWNQYWISENGTSGSTVGGVVFAAEDDDPFEIVEIEKMEVWRNNKQIGGWSASQHPLQRGPGQISSLGDEIRVEILRNTQPWQIGYNFTKGEKRMGPMIGITIYGGPSGIFSDNPSVPFRYLFKLWIRTTTISEYKRLDIRN